MLQIGCEIKRRDQHEKNKFHRYPAKVGHLGEKSLVVQKSGMKNEKEKNLFYKCSVKVCQFVEKSLFFLKIAISRVGWREGNG